MPLPLPPGTAAVIVAAGAGLRAGQPLPKQFARWRGKPVLRHSVEAMLAAGVTPIVVAIPEGADALAAKALAGLAGVSCVTGGATRQQSVRIALEALASAAPHTVLIHDAARPDLPGEVIERLVAVLTLAPAAHRAWPGDANAGDDAQVARAAGLEIRLVDGDERLHKLTFASDFAALPPVRVGTGFDVHRLAPGEELWLCGVKIEHSHGLAGHSDADVAIHALVDAVLGAIGAGDIGTHFPPSDPQWRGASSDRFLTHAVSLAAVAGYTVGNVDLTLICEAPKIGPHREAMRARLAELLGVDLTAVSVKATTTERLGFAGRGEGIAAQAVALLVRT